MKKLILILAAFVSMLAIVRAENRKQPILPGFHADPEVLYSNLTKKYYIYSTTDGTPGWGGHDFSVFSSTPCC